MDNFRSLLLSINDEIEQEDLESMKFYCKTHIGAGILERVNRPTRLFEELEKRNRLGPDNKDFLAELLDKVGRRDLKNKLLGLREAAVVSRTTVPNAPVVTGSLNESHLHDISEELGRDWKILGRKLGLKSNILENIDVDYRRVKEKTYQVILRWKRQNGVNATGQALADALTLISRKDVADMLARMCNRNDSNRGVHAPVEHVVNEGPLENMPEGLRQNLPTQEEHDSAKHEKDPAEETNVTDGPQDIRPPVSEPRPSQETASPAVKSLMGILDPDRYFVIKQIGSGSCGKVYLCKTKDMQHTYAVKQVDLGMNNKETQKQVKHLKKEIKILRKLKNEYIVTLYYAEDTKHTLSIFMEYLSGGSIHDYLTEKGVMEEKRVRKYTYQILKGCEYLHQNGVIHMDLKGANVLIDSYGNIRLADFGIAKDLEKVKTSTGSTTRSFGGTLYWSSPELANNEKPSYVFDIWSIGCTVIEMLTTKPPNHELLPAAALLKIAKREVHPPPHLSELAKSFINMCFMDQKERPCATDLLKDEFPTENAPNEDEK